MSKKIRTTIEPDKVLEVSDLEAEQLTRMGLVASTARDSTPATNTASADKQKETSRGR